MSVELKADIDQRVRILSTGRTGIVIAVNGYGSVSELQKLYHMTVQLDDGGEKIQVQPEEFETI